VRLINVSLSFQRVYQAVKCAALLPGVRVLIDCFSSSGGVSVLAAAIKHRIPSFAYVLAERDSPGALDAVKAKSLGVKPGPKYAQLKAGQSVYTDVNDSMLVRPEDVMGQPRRGLRLVVFGDTCDDSEVIPHIRDCDLLIHEATMEDALREKAVEFGHSTPSMVAALAAQVRAKRVVLTHVSPRYKPLSADCDGKKDTSAKVLLDEARACLLALDAASTELHVAEDFFELAL